MVASLFATGAHAQPHHIPADVQRSETILKDWEFRHDHEITATEGWEAVSVPHDWAIYGPFDKSNDLQTVAVVQNGENLPTNLVRKNWRFPG